MWLFSLQTCFISLQIKRPISGAKAEMRKNGLESQSCYRSQRAQEPCQKAAQSNEVDQINFEPVAKHTPHFCTREHMEKAMKRRERLCSPSSLVFASPQLAAYDFREKKRNPFFSHNRGKKQHERGRMAEFPRKKERGERGGEGGRLICMALLSTRPHSLTKCFRGLGVHFGSCRRIVKKWTYTVNATFRET